jgi:hypothetical protein
MDTKLKTLFLAFAILLFVIFISDSVQSVQAMLSLITFIMIYHFYLQRHFSDVQDIISQ